MHLAEFIIDIHPVRENGGIYARLPDLKTIRTFAVNGHRRNGVRMEYP